MRLNNITFKRITVTTSSAPATIFNLPEMQAQGNPVRVIDVSGSRLFYETALRQPGEGLIALDTITRKTTTVATDGFFQGELEFDTNDVQYLCNYNISSGLYSNYTIDQYSGLASGSSDLTKSRTLYIFGAGEACGTFRRAGDTDLIFTDQTYFFVDGSDLPKTRTRFFKGTTQCERCSIPDSAFAIVDDRVTDFDLSSEYIFYGVSDGLYRIDLSGANRKKIADASPPTGVTGVRYAPGADKVFYNDGRVIRAVNPDGTNGQQ